MQQIVPEPVDSVEVTILADSFFDGLLVSEGPARRPSLSPQVLDVPTPFMEGGLAFDPGMLVPTHCTGYKATHALNARLPAAFYQSSVSSIFAL